MTTTLLAQILIDFLIEEENSKAASEVEYLVKKKKRRRRKCLFASLYNLQSELLSVNKLRQLLKPIFKVKNAMKNVVT